MSISNKIDIPALRESFLKTVREVDDAREKQNMFFARLRLKQVNQEHKNGGACGCDTFTFQVKERDEIVEVNDELHNSNNPDVFLVGMVKELSRVVRDFELDSDMVERDAKEYESANGGVPLLEYTQRLSKIHEVKDVLCQQMGDFMEQLKKYHERSKGAS